MSEYTPDTGEVRHYYVSGKSEDMYAASYMSHYEPEFDRWLAAHDAEQVRELQAERDIAREQVRQRDEVLERVRALANESERDEWDAVERILPAIRAALEGDGR